MNLSYLQRIKLPCIQFLYPRIWNKKYAFNLTILLPMYLAIMVNIQLIQVIIPKVCFGFIPLMLWPLWGNVVLKSLLRVINDHNRVESIWGDNVRSLFHLWDSSNLLMGISWEFPFKTNRWFFDYHHMKNHKITWSCVILSDSMARL